MHAPVSEQGLVDRRLAGRAAPPGWQRSVVGPAAERLVEQAREGRSRQVAGSDPDEFFRGVESGARYALRVGPGGSAQRLTDQPPCFRWGYLRAFILVGDALASPAPPMRLPMPSGPAGDERAAADRPAPTHGVADDEPISQVLPSPHALGDAFLAHSPAARLAPGSRPPAVRKRGVHSTGRCWQGRP